MRPAGAPRASEARVTARIKARVKTRVEARSGWPEAVLVVAVLGAALLVEVWGRGPGLSWLVRVLAYVVVGVVVLGLIRARNTARSRERELTMLRVEREREVSTERLALVQLVSHEVRTPLTVIRGTIETLRARGSQDDGDAAELRALLTAAQRAVLRLEDLLEVLLAAAEELDTIDRPITRVELRQVVEHAAATLREPNRRPLKLEVPAELHVCTVETELWLILRCLLDNAAKFSPPDSPVHVDATRIDDPCGQRVLVRIRDLGIGLPEGFGEAAFEPFRQADSSSTRSHAGMGMGLTTARRLARRLGGEVTLDNAEGGGVEAWILLPELTPIE